jgi:hypothetical protein
MIVHESGSTSQFPPLGVQGRIEKKLDGTPSHIVPCMIGLLARNHDTDWDRYGTVHMMILALAVSS